MQDCRGNIFGASRFGMRLLWCTYRILRCTCQRLHHCPAHHCLHHNFLHCHCFFFMFSLHKNRSCSKISILPNKLQLPGRQWVISEIRCSRQRPTNAPAPVLPSQWVVPTYPPVLPTQCYLPTYPPVLPMQQQQLPTHQHNASAAIPTTHQTTNTVPHQQHPAAPINTGAITE